ncbi:MAG TPA: glycosyltransferase family 4 protein [Candidatus Limnocylindrales bacterium]|jgi:glycosyltransferase involved in cell wall biosynthesis|nr:glycosyltransferase family 4 protein [Candidatus Limnocylindrales bacterium]
MTEPATIVPQHLVLVLPSTGEFDSRTYRIATSCITRGHTVTVMARHKAELPWREDDPAGFTLIRVLATAEDGMPMRPLVRAGRVAVRRLESIIRRHPYRPPGTPRDDASGAAPAPGSAPDTGRRAPLYTRAWMGLYRRVAIPLQIRSHRRNAARVTPRGDLVHGMAFMGIPVALSIGARDGIPVVYDARDIHLEARNLARMGRPARWLLGRTERRWAEAATRVISVNDAYADVLASRWPIERPLVVMNCSYRYTPVSPRQRRFHEALGLPDHHKVVLYHGGLFPWRGIEQLIEAIREVPDATLVLMGYGVLEPALRAQAADPSLAGTVRVMDAVPPAELHDWVAAADVVGMPIQGDTLNHRLTTPNKLFEAMAAGVPAVVSDLPGMSAIVTDAESGILVDPTDVPAIAAAIRRIVSLPAEEWQAWRERCVAAAHDRYNWETQVDRLLDLYSHLTGKRW